MVGYLVAAAVLTFLVALVAAALTGRVELRSCCSPADASQYLRMRAAFTEEPATPAEPRGNGLGDP